MTKKLNFNHIPQDVKSNLKAIYLKKTALDFGFIDLNSPAFRNTNGDIVTYTIALKSSQKKKDIYYDNLVIENKPSGLKEFYVFRYFPDQDWLASDRDLRTYSGKIQVFNFMTGSQLAETNVEEGIWLEPENRVITCAFTQVGFICTAGYCVYFFELQCSDDGGGGGGGSCITCEYPDPPNPGPGGGIGNPGTAPILGDGEDEPIIVECGEGEEPNMFGECELIDCPEGFIRDSEGECVEANPCDKINSLESDSAFKNKLQELEQNTTLDYETGFLLNHNGTAFDPIAGDPGDDFIDFNITGPIDGFLHSHVLPNGDSIFSPDDIRALYILFDGGYVNNPSTFVMSVVTGHGTSYSIIIDDVNAFSSFSQNNLNSQTNFNSFSNYYNNNYVTNNLIGLDEITAREVAMLIALENSGLSLLKGNSDYSDWQKKEAQEREAVDVDCN